MLMFSSECSLSHPFHSQSYSYQPAFQSSSMSRIEVRKEDIKIDINMYYCQQRKAIVFVVEHCGEANCLD